MPNIRRSSNPPASPCYFLPFLHYWQNDTNSNITEMQKWSLRDYNPTSRGRNDNCRPLTPNRYSPPLAYFHTNLLLKFEDSVDLGEQSSVGRSLWSGCANTDTSPPWVTRVFSASARLRHSDANGQRMHHARTPSRLRNASARAPQSMANVAVRPASTQVAAAMVTDLGASFTGHPVLGLRMWL